ARAFRFASSFFKPRAPTRHASTSNRRLPLPARTTTRLIQRSSLPSPPPPSHQWSALLVCSSETLALHLEKITPNEYCIKIQYLRELTRIMCWKQSKCISLPIKPLHKGVIWRNILIGGCSAKLQQYY